MKKSKNCPMKRSSHRKQRHQRQTSKKNKVIHEVKWLGISFLIMSGIMTLAVLMTYSFGRMSGYSMMPAVSNNNIVVVNKVAPLQRFDLVYFKLPNNQEMSIRRVIGIPGDEIVYKEDSLFVNNEGKPERYLNSLKKKLVSGLLTDDFSLEALTTQKKVPPNMYFVLGDNRQSASDSREYGFVKREDIRGKVESRLFPLDKVRGY